MLKTDYLILGGGIAGVTAAETIRRQDKKTKIILVSAEPHLLYSRVLLPNFLKKKLPREKLFLRSAKDFSEKNIEIISAAAAEIIPDKKEIRLRDNSFISYQKLLIASGGYPTPWGEKKFADKIFRLQTLDDADHLREKLDFIKKPVVIGGSFIVLEFLEIFIANNISPTLLLREKHFFHRQIDASGADILEENFRQYGVEIIKEDEVEKMETANEDRLKITTKNKKKLNTDAFCAGIGLERFLDFTGPRIAKGERGVKTNEFLETSQKDIWAAGDIAEFYDIISEKHILAGNWTNAFLQGQRAGLNMTGDRKEFRSVPTYSLTNLGVQITALGRTGDFKSAIIRSRPADKIHACVFTEKDTIIGATLLNSFQDKPVLSELIEKKINIKPYREKMANPDFDIKSIPIV